MGLCSGHGNFAVIHELWLYPQSLLAKLSVFQASRMYATTMHVAMPGVNVVKPLLMVRVCTFVCVCACVRSCVCVCVCVSHMVQWYVQRFPIDRLRVRFPTIMVTHVFLLFLRLFLTFLSFSWVVTNSQCMPEYVV